MAAVKITPERELLKGRTIVVTGAASGLGRATAYVAAYHGADVAIVDLNDDAASKTRDEIAKDFDTVKATSHRCDITDESAVENLFSEIVKEHRAVHGLAQCAGMFGPGVDINDQSLAAFEREIKVNTTGTFLMNKWAVRQFQQQNKHGVPVPEGGWSIVNIGSKASTAGNSKAVAYVASKHAVLGITRCVAIEQAANHIRANCCCPGPVDTPLTRSGTNIPLDAPLDVMNAKLREIGILDSILLKRMGQPEDIAHQVIYLLGPRASFVTHGAFAVDGGWI